MKSFRKHGIATAAEALRKFSNDPRKNSSSVSTDNAAAPAASSSRAKASASNERRISPLDGEAFFNSAITAIPGCPTSGRFCQKWGFSRARRNPRGTCLSASRSNSRKSAVRLDSATRARVAATIVSRRAVMKNPSIIRERAQVAARRRNFDVVIKHKKEGAPPLSRFPRQGGAFEFLDDAPNCCEIRYDPHTS